ncbi:tetratricopeptide repeat-containing sensor histidine kinase [Winogradskyella forsetii]|uniref:tetratricopeptide repeat-containing sensor histidine kinase n=1 Tax=Winogradskyella forsetii TaxID=2686077 RepID=UPI0015BEF257|nr:ATP-binding protein [Winogradskyella forsetii]
MLFIVTFCGYTQSLTEKKLLDSIQNLFHSADNEDISNIKTFKLLKQANEIAKKLKNDSIILLTQKKIRNYYYKERDFDKYIDANHKIISLAERLSDSSSLAHAYNALGYSYFLTEKKDSSYHFYLKAVVIFDKINAEVDLSYALGSLSKLQLDGKDYYGSGENAIKALKLLNGVEETNDILDQKWILYNTLSSISDALNDNSQALAYHDQALAVAGRMENDFNNGIYTLNNIGYLKRKQGLYKEAKEIFTDILNEKNLFEDDPTFFALILENLAYTNYLSGSYDREKTIDMFERSYEIADSLDDEITKTGAAISMAKFYKGIDDKKNAFRFSKKAYDLSKRIKKTDILLESMVLMSDLTEGNESKQYLNEHIKLTDSLLNEERSVRNKYARIEYETDQLEAENKQISKENLYLLILSIGLLLTAILVYVVISQRSKNRKLKLMQVQQKANEDIYNLMLRQQDKVDEARAKEKIRVSKELHDGVLGPLFGARLSLDSINFNEGKEAMMARAKYIGQLQSIEQDIRKISHDLSVDFESGSSFIDIVTELIETQTKAYNLEHEFNSTDAISWDLVSNKTKINIYRIIQESMQNIYKHANAKAIEISISLENDLICLDIIDDGDGFDTTKSKKGIGLKNMTSRVEDIDGKISFISQPGNGTQVNVKIPIPN